MQDPRPDLIDHLVGHAHGRRRRITHRRDPHPVAGSQLAHRLGTATIDPDLAGTDQPVDQRTRHAAKLAHQIIVEPLTVMITADLDFAS